MSVRKFLMTLIVTAACAILALPLAAMAQGEPTATVSFEYGSGGLILSASGGRGTLRFQGRNYTFKMGSLGVGVVGVSKIRGSGQVYNLNRVEDFGGGYFQANASYAAGSGKGVLWLENTNGVVLKLRTTSKGLALNFGVDGLMIELPSAAKK